MEISLDQLQDRLINAKEDETNKSMLREQALGRRRAAHRGTIEYVVSSHCRANRNRVFLTASVPLGPLVDG